MKMLFNVKYGNGKEPRSVEFEELKELLAFIMGCDCSILIRPNWQSKAWDIEVRHKE
jgi:hypothetical protein